QCFPHQSIPTLQNPTNSIKPYLKLSINLLNTSTLPTLKPHSLVTPPIISNSLTHFLTPHPYLPHNPPLLLFQQFPPLTYHPP
ncbi:IucA/IucC family protein, partial [Bacillus mycoides]|uniref:IucA/IucC family protein n=1 Tax=Bacillus mycoides TaxID=1405 RepID=UPI001C92C5C4